MSKDNATLSLLDYVFLGQKRGIDKTMLKWHTWGIVCRIKKIFIGLFRINIGDLIAYARCRRYFRDIISQLIDNVGLNNVTFGAYIKYAAKVIFKKDIHDKTNS